MKKITDVNELRHIQLDMMQYIHVFCIENDIRYSLAFGSMFGAVRHHGFIPCDDDIDIMMPRPDYEKFCKLFNCFNNKNYKAYDYRKDKEYNYPFMKVCDERTIRIEKTTVRGLGIYIDVFPIDYFADSYDEALSVVKKITFWKRIFVSKIMEPTNKVSLVKNIAIVLAKLFSSFIPMKYVLRKFDEFSCASSNKTRKYCGFLVDANKTSILKAELFNSYSDYPFEQYVFKGIADYDSYLKVQYGDYMTPPPSNQQTTMHDIVDMYWK